MSERVVVLGSINVDLMTRVDRLPRAGETVGGLSLSRTLGGKGGNQAVAAARAGAEAILIGATGNDQDGAVARADLAAFGVDVRRVAVRETPTGVAVVITSSDDNQIVVVPGANAAVTEELFADLCLHAGDICLAQLETPVTATRRLFERARAAGAVTIFNPAPATADALDIVPLADVVVLNETEVQLLAGVVIDDASTDEQLDDAAARLGMAANATMIVTLGARGLVSRSAGRTDRLAAVATTVIDTTGAGDCFCGYLAAGLARGDALAVALAEANAAAALAVSRPGAAIAVPERSSVLNHLALEASG